MNFAVIAIVSFVTGVLASLGLGGGMVLIIYLTVFANISQINAQGINLIFFVPIAMVSLYYHNKNNLIEWKKTVPILIAGTVFVIIFSIIANNTDNSILQKLFGGFVIIAGIKEVFAKGKN
ncbi:MAG: TSUP family transporter, partial [Oscillospiraceae bacterium]